MNKVKEFFTENGDVTVITWLGSYVGFIVLKRLKRSLFPNYSTGRIKNITLLIAMLVWSWRFGIATAARYDVFIRPIFQTTEKEKVNGED